MSDPDSEDPAEILPPPGRAARLRARLRKIADWRHDRMLQRLYGNALKLLAGEGTAALLGLASLALTTRALGISEWGVLATVMAFTHLVGNLIKFQTWQAVVKFGADALARDDSPALQRLVRFTTSLDLGTAAIAVAICLLAMPWYLDWVGIDARHLDFALVYCAGALFTISATPTGILRLFDRFDLMAMIAPVGPLTRLAACTVAYFYGGGLWAFGMIWLASVLIDRVILIFVGWRELARRGHARGLLRVGGVSTEGHAGLLKFAVAGNLQSSINAAVKEVDTILVARLVGPDAAGLWTLAKRFAAVLGGPARLFVVSAFPQLARLWATHDYRMFRRFVLRTSLTAGGGGLLATLGFALIGPWIVVLVFGAKNAAAYLPTLLMMLSRSVGMFATPMTPALLAMNRPVKSLKIAAAMAAINLPITVALTAMFGLLGVGLGRIAAEALPLVVTSATVFRTLQRHRERAARAQAHAHAAAE